MSTKGSLSEEFIICLVMVVLFTVFAIGLHKVTKNERRVKEECEARGGVLIRSTNVKSGSRICIDPEALK